MPVTADGSQLPKRWCRATPPERKQLPAATSANVDKLVLLEAHNKSPAV